jgi:hypothetical protein
MSQTIIKNPKYAEKMEDDVLSLPIAFSQKALKDKTHRTYVRKNIMSFMNYEKKLKLDATNEVKA